MALLSSLRTLLVLLALQESAEAVTSSMDLDHNVPAADPDHDMAAAPTSVVDQPSFLDAPISQEVQMITPETGGRSLVARTAETVRDSADLVNQFLNAAHSCSWRMKVHGADPEAVLFGPGWVDWREAHPSMVESVPTGLTATLLSGQKLMVRFVLAMLKGVKAGMAYDDLAAREERGAAAADKWVLPRGNHGRMILFEAVDLRKEVRELVAAFSTSEEGTLPEATQRGLHFEGARGLVGIRNDWVWGGDRRSIWGRIGDFLKYRHELIRGRAGFWDWENLALPTQQPNRLGFEFDEMMRGCLALLREDDGKGDWKDVGGGSSAGAFHQSWEAVKALMPKVRKMLDAAERHLPYQEDASGEEDGDASGEEDWDIGGRSFL